ncbi:hypothetical protein, partial [Streptomyces sp. NPDC050388]|uniref:hypothetical protein n=1 Tax=Streptomyces sp. NPDC050388 TaxID=3155781 RepID=UPI00342F4568
MSEEAFPRALDGVGARAPIRAIVQPEAAPLPVTCLVSAWDQGFVGDRQEGARAMRAHSQDPVPQPVLSPLTNAA